MGKLLEYTAKMVNIVKAGLLTYRHNFQIRLSQQSLCLTHA